MAEEFHERDLRGARFVESDLTDVVIRGSEISGMQIDAPWLPFGEPLTVNVVDVVGFVEGELNKRFPGRDQWRATDPAGLRQALESAERAWDDAIARAAALPEGSVDRRVDGEWSFAETLRHLVHATDIWVGRSALGRDDAHPLAVGHGVADIEPAPYDDVLAARASRVAMVRDLLATVTQEQLDEPRPNPHDPERTETVGSCVRVVLEESWEHLRFALRDLDAIEVSARTATT
jgi:uncharacterized damage-inducible protein DinB